MAKKPQIVPKTFEDALAELEQILAQIEGGALGLDESLTKYERGNFLIHHCRGVLNTAEKQIEMLAQSPDGALVSSPLQAGPDAPAPAPSSESESFEG